MNRKNAKYVLKGDAADKVFKVNENTGDVFAFERLDREKVSEYHLTALVVDKDTNKDLEPPSSFTIKVHDINDNWPVFSRQVYNASVPEMSAMGMCQPTPYTQLQTQSTGTPKPPTKSSLPGSGLRSEIIRAHKALPVTLYDVGKILVPNLPL